jgi:hypothetical protein
MTGPGAALVEPGLRLTLYGRQWCHLCEDMRAALEPFLRGTGIGVEVIDIDTDPLLEQRFDERVPVLMHGELEICHYHLDLAALQAALATHLRRGAD